MSAIALVFLLLASPPDAAPAGHGPLAKVRRTLETPELKRGEAGSMGRPAVILDAHERVGDAMLVGRASTLVREERRNAEWALRAWRDVGAKRKRIWHVQVDPIQ